MSNPSSRVSWKIFILSLPEENHQGFYYGYETVEMGRNNHPFLLLFRTVYIVFTFLKQVFLLHCFRFVHVIAVEKIVFVHSDASPDCIYVLLEGRMVEV